MKLAIMQPYLFPYFGYFQLIRSVDEFVIYDDVNYIKGGWINRNYILGNGERQLITLPLQGASPNKLINQIEVGGKHKILQSIRHNYAKAPYFDTIYPIIGGIINQQESNLSNFLHHQLTVLCKYLNINPKWHISSQINKNNELRGQDKVISICEKLGANHYINTPGGQSLYIQSAFMDRKIKLSFIHPKPIDYCQFGASFVPNLSIIDVIMFNSRDQCSKLLDSYDLT